MKRKFFAAFLSLCMVMSLVPMTALAAEGDSVAQVGNEKYTSLADAVSNAADGATIQMLANVDISTTGLMIPATKSLTLDINGKEIKAANTATGRIVVYGHLTIKDSTDTNQDGADCGKIYTETDYMGSATGYSVIGIVGENASATMESGYIYAVRNDASNKGQFGVGVEQGGDFTMTGGKIEAGWYAVSGNGNNKTQNSEINITGGELISTADYAIYLPHSGVTNISGGVIYGAAGGISIQRNILNISGDVLITSKGTGDTGNWGDGTGGQDCAAVNVNASYGDGDVNISGGTLTAENDAIVLATGVTHSIDVSVTGGTFSGDVTEYFPEGAILTQDETGAVTPRAPGEGETVIAEVNSVPYNSIKNAINAAQDGDIVVLKATSTNNDSIVISDGRSITLDMNGFDIGFAQQKNISLYHGELNITGKGMLYEESPWFGPVMIYGAEENVSNYSVVTIGEDVTLRGWSGLFIDQHDEHGAQAYGIVATIYGTLESVKDTSGAGGHALYINGTIKETTGNVPKITLNGATLTTELGNGMYLAGYADTTIVDSTITSIGEDSTGIEIRAGKLTIEGNTTVTASQGEVEVLPNGNGSTSANVALAVAQHTTKLPIELTVTGGTFIGGAALNEMNPQKNNPEDIARVSLKVSGGEFIGIINSEDFAEFITGGHFSSPVDQDYLETDLTAELYSLRNTATPYSYYPSVEEAQAAAQPGDVVTDLSTVKEDAKQFTITFDYGDGTKKTVELWEGAETTLPTLNDRGYNHFVGWSDQAGNHYNGGQTVKITVDMTFTAQWTYIPPANPNYQIAIGDFANGTVTANPSAAKAGATVTLTATPDEGYALGTLTVTDRFGDAVRVTEQANGTYTFTMPDGQVTVTATFVETEAPVAEPFIDVAEGDWFYDAVVYAYQNELMDGVGGNRFAPNSETTRAQLVTILYRLEGEPAVSGDLPFTDVETGIWYTDAILWAAQNNIVNGVSDTEFAPGDDLTRQQLVTILYRYAEAKGYDVSASADLSGYPDADQVQDYAQPAMAWAVAENIIQGMEDGTLKPAGNASRAQIATILMRFCEDVAQ